MPAVSDSTKAWLPDKGFLSNLTVILLIKAHIRAYMFQAASSDKAVDEEKFLGPFSTMVMQFERYTDPSKKMEALIYLQGMWKHFSRLTRSVPLPIAIPPPSPQNQKLATANKGKSNITDDEGFTLPSKSAKNLILTVPPKLRLIINLKPF